MTADWSPGLVLFSVIVAVLGSFTALIHAQRMRQSEGRAATVWMGIGGITLGLSIWAMHFIGMLAYHLPIDVTYDTGLTVLSLVSAMAAAVLGFRILRSEHVSTAKVVAGGAVMGLGISGMHYIGMAAIRMDPPIRHNPGVVVLATAIAMGAAMAALLIMHRSRQRHEHPGLVQVASALVMGLAIAGMHYTAMQDMHIAANSVCLGGALALPTDVLSLAVGGGIVTLLVSGLLAALFDQRQARLQAESLARSHAYLEKSPDSLLVVDTEGMILYANRRARDMFDFADTAPEGCPLQQLVADQQPGTATTTDPQVPPASPPLPRALAYLHALQGHDVVARTRDGEKFMVDLSVSPVEFHGTSEVLVAVRDVTQRRAAERRVRETEAMLRGMSDMPAAGGIPVPSAFGWQGSLPVHEQAGADPVWHAGRGVHGTRRDGPGHRHPPRRRPTAADLARRRRNPQHGMGV